MGSSANLTTNSAIRGEASQASHSSLDYQFCPNAPAAQIVEITVTNRTIGRAEAMQAELD
jgi:hypothetical protein